VGHNNIIELNGKQYDAITGTLLGESRIKATPEKRHPAAAHAVHKGRTMDGVTRRIHAAGPASTSKAPQPAAKTTPTPKPHTIPASRKMDVNWPANKSVKRHKPERSQTLMRHVVKKPAATMKPAIKTVSPSELQARPAHQIAKQLEKKVAVSNVNPVRLSHAAHTAKSQHIQRFKQPHYVEQPHAIAPPKSAAPKQQAIYELPIAPKPRPSADIFEAALARATSHTQPTPRRGRHGRANRKLVSALAGALAFLVIGGFVAYLNMPALELRVASARAGFHASMPAYSPTGYALADGVESSKGKVVLSYRSGDSSYKVTQMASNWNSQTLLDHYTETHGAPEQTIQSQGRIIYLYDDTRAAWVNGGVRFEISGNASLTSRDLVSLATSL
jgi:hypothetical protein